MNSLQALKVLNFGLIKKRSPPETFIFNFGPIYDFRNFMWFITIENTKLYMFLKKGIQMTKL